MRIYAAAQLAGGHDFKTATAGKPFC